MAGEDYQKFIALEEDKRQRIINAAMHEFLGGFKKASTDNIVREAGISKGLLFHYFGTKEKLYNFLVDYAIDTVRAEYVDLINTHQKDILDSIWQLSLLKQDLAYKFPSIFDFIVRVYVDGKDGPAKEQLERLHAMREKMLQEVFARCDRSLFKDDIPADKAIEIIMMVMNGFSQQKADLVNKDRIGQEVKENYELYLAELKEYLDLLRKVFYK